MGKLMVHPFRGKVSFLSNRVYIWEIVYGYGEEKGEREKKLNFRAVS